MELRSLAGLRSYVGGNVQLASYRVCLSFVAATNGDGLVCNSRAVDDGDERQTSYIVYGCTMQVRATAGTTALFRWTSLFIQTFDDRSSPSDFGHAIRALTLRCTYVVSRIGR